MNKIVFFIGAFFFLATAKAQDGTSTTGNWNQLFVNKSFSNNWSFSGDMQYRTHEIGQDFQQFIIRGAAGYSPKDTEVTFLAGYAYFSTGAVGDSEDTFYEHRLYQDIIFPSNVAPGFFVNHRFRLEERFIEDQDFEGRLRYTLFLNIPLNMKTMDEKAFYLAFWNEIFINTQQNSGPGSLYDRDWAHAGVGYIFSNTFKLHAGYMREITRTQSKGQLVLAGFLSF